MIPVNQPALSQEDLSAVACALDSGWVSSSGECIEAFENAWAEYCGVRYGVAVSSGTAALQVAVEAAGIGHDDEVIMPTFTIISCVLAVIRAGAVPVFIDSVPDYWCMDVEQIEAKITRRTKAIMAVHIYGHPVDMRSVMNIAGKHGLLVIEDAAEAHGALYAWDDGRSGPRWSKCGGIGHVAAFSFFANKLITTGEGGMVVTNCETIATASRSLRNLCFSSTRRFMHERLGYQFRMTNMQAALGLAQVRRIEMIVERKRWLATQYAELLSALTAVEKPVERPWARNVFWAYGIVLAEEVAFEADEFARRLRTIGVDTRPFFLGMHEQPILRDLNLISGEQFPVSERLSRRGLYLPSGLALTKSDVVAVCAGVTRALSDL